MSQPEVFRPQNGPLMVRGNLADGLGARTDSFRKDSRPGTQGSGYRFGQLSHNSFFARHNPHPGRVRHIKGLLDVPICAVNDELTVASPRFSTESGPNFPPNNFDTTKLAQYSKYYSMPVNAINVNSQKHPINTITGLQYFVGKPLNFRIFREKAVPKVGMVPVTEAWRDELRALTEAAGIQGLQRDQPRREPERPRTTQYSAETGRLIPPPSRAMSRQASRAAKRDQFMHNLNHISEEPDSENMVLQMLCQILQTDDVNAVQSWLCSAGDREKALVLDMIRTAMTVNDDYYKQPNAEYIEANLPPVQEKPIEPETIGASDKLDRLTLENVSPRPVSRGTEGRYQWAVPQSGGGAKPSSQQAAPLNRPASGEDVTKAPVISDAFRPSKSRGSDRPASRAVSHASRPKTPAKPATPMNLGSEPKLRYTRTPVQDQDISAQKASLSNVLNSEQPNWQPDQSTV